MKKYIVALDQGTTSSRTIVFDHDGNIASVAQKEFTQIFPQPGWVEHCPREIWPSQASTIIEALVKGNISTEDIAAVGITNQRETTIVWDAETGEPVYNAIVWQDGRTAAFCSESGLVQQEQKIREKTGLILNPYFSASKIRWILDHVEGARQKAEAGKLRFGTVDTWLIWNLTKGRKHVTDVSNASRTLLYNIHTLDWDDELLALFDIPRSMMPEVHASSEVYGYTDTSIVRQQIPIAGIAGDQQAALFGQMCTEAGSVKNTYGTGCFLLMNTGDKAIYSQNRLLTTIAWKIGDKVTYALEGSIFVGGSVVQWLREGLGIIKKSRDIEALALSVEDNGGVYFVPALTGLGAPYWDPNAKGTITGLTRGTTLGHIARATDEGIAFQTMDIVNAMRKDAGIDLGDLKVDGGASRDNYLLQVQADVLGTKVVRPTIVETTAKGAAYLAGLAVGFWKDIDEIKRQWAIDRVFEPTTDQEHVQQMKDGWADAIRRALS